MNIKSLLLFRNLKKIRSFEKKELIINEGDSEKDVYLILNGLVRSYLITENGEEITFQIFAENQVFGNAHAILFNEPSRFYYETFERTKVLCLDQKSFRDLTFSDPDQFGTRLLQQAFNRLDSFVFLSPEERYHRFIKDHPHLINRVPDKYIANVLGITPVSLSRIRGRIAAKKS